MWGQGDQNISKKLIPCYSRQCAILSVGKWEGVHKSYKWEPKMSIPNDNLGYREQNLLTLSKKAFMKGKITINNDEGSMAALKNPVALLATMLKYCHPQKAVNAQKSSLYPPPRSCTTRIPHLGHMDMRASKPNHQAEIAKTCQKRHGCSAWKSEVSTKKTCAIWCFHCLHTTSISVHWKSCKKQIYSRDRSQGRAWCFFNCRKVNPPMNYQQQ